jgi:hypothetical protein
VNNLLEMVAVQPLTEKPSENGSCPFCSSSSISRGAYSTTLVGGGTGPDDDPNHTHTSCVCQDCKKNFVRETRSGNVWYTEMTRVLRGMPSCFEDYVYPCKCGGNVTRKHLHKVDGKELRYLSYDKNGPNFKTMYSCDKCNVSIETINDYWYKGWDAPPPPPRDPNKKFDWVIEELPGIVTINDYSVAKVNIVDEEKTDAS